MQRRITVIALGVWLAGLGLGSVSAQAASSRRAARGRKPPVDKGPAETRAERDKRLQRECRGKPNAGACEGYGN